MMRSIAPKGMESMPLARYIQRAWPMLPGFAVREALMKRDARVNGARADAKDCVRAGDEILLYLPAKYAPAPLSILYADEALIAFVKPRGLPVDADEDGIGEDTALSRLTSQFPGARLAHRLDAGTGGVMLAARTNAMEALLLAAFRAHQVKKTYAALALGAFSQKEETLEAYLEKDAQKSKVRVTARPGADAKRICTRYTVLNAFAVRGCALANLQVEIPTGRTHQIRAHLAYMGHPLAGDDKYGDRRANDILGAKEICLWCEGISLAGAEGLDAYVDTRFEEKRPEWKIRE